ncbi:MAG: TetR/AcrR family transcriptional regulator [Aeromicrobium sp.]
MGDARLSETRKVPRQKRSREMVERILAAGRTVVLRDGYDAASTNRIAAEADISPGSLYQYFPNKEAVLNAIVNRYFDDTAASVTAALADRFDDETGPEIVRATLEALLDALEDNTELLRIVSDQLPRSENRDRTEALEQGVTGLLSAYLAARPPQLRRGLAPTTAAWILVRAVENLAVRYVLDRPPIDRAAFVDELERLVAGYLVDA